MGDLRVRVTCLVRRHDLDSSVAFGVVELLDPGAPRPVNITADGTLVDGVGCRRCGRFWDYGSDAWPHPVRRRLRILFVRARRRPRRIWRRVTGWVWGWRWRYLHARGKHHWSECPAADHHGELIGINEDGALLVPSETHANWWDRPFRKRNPTHWPYWWRSWRRCAHAEIEAMPHPEEEQSV